MPTMRATPVMSCAPQRLRPASSCSRPGRKGSGQALRAVLSGWPPPTLWGWALRAQARAVVARPPPTGAPSTRRLAVLCAAVAVPSHQASMRSKPRSRLATHRPACSWPCRVKGSLRRCAPLTRSPPCHAMQRQAAKEEKRAACTTQIPVGLSCAGADFSLSGGSRAERLAVSSVRACAPRQNALLRQKPPTQGARLLHLAANPRRV